MSARLPTHHQTGVALITVLLVVFLASVAATALASIQQLVIRRSTLLLHQQQARYYALGGEQWAAVILERDLENSETDHSGEAWATLPPVLPVEGGGVTGSIQDLQGRFNLNNLLSNTPVGQNRTGRNTRQNQTNNINDEINSFQLEALQRLLEILELDPDIAQAIADWIDPDQATRFPEGAEDGEYTSRTPPYLSANRPLLSISELRLIKGIDQDVYTSLIPYVWAMPLDPDKPVPTPVNVNTTTPPVLAALADIDLNRATALIEDRGSTGYRKIDDFFSAAKLANSSLAKENLTVTSRYFLIQVEARVGSAKTAIKSVLQRPEKRDGDGETNRSRILLRSFGRDD